LVVDRGSAYDLGFSPADIYASLMSSPYLSLKAQSPHLWLFHLEAAPLAKTFPVPFVPAAQVVPLVDRIGVVRLVNPVSQTRVNDEVHLEISVQNGSSVAWPGEASSRRIPVRLLVSWRTSSAPDASRVNETRILFPNGVLPRQPLDVVATVQAPARPGSY